MAVDGIICYVDAVAESVKNLVSKHHLHLHERADVGREDRAIFFFFPCCSANHEQDWLGMNTQKV